MAEVKAMSRAGRFNQIKMAIALHHQRTNAPELSAYDIARKIGMRAESPQFRGILSDMVRDGQLAMRVVDTSSTNKVAKFKAWYSLIDADTPKKREVAIKSKGKLVGQMRLF